MTPTLRSIFDRAVELPPDQRDDFLTTACANDLKLRAAVESLLTAHDRAGSFLADPLIPPDLLQAREQLSPGSRIARYQLLRILGEGGYGTVYLAEQDPPLRRNVALKLIKPGMDSRQVIARFELERQSLALLDHPNIAKVFDAGSTSTGHPFFVMELVDGLPITEFCRSHELDLYSRLRLFMSVCAAVQHAHEKGVIHRDLKPGNILVVIQDGNPTPKVIDFGIAKALLPDKHPSDDLHHPITLQPQFLGTPQYMSPEQAQPSGANVDWRSDVYSLGTLLYELLTDAPPFDRSQFDRAAFAEIERILHEVHPPLPSARLLAKKSAAPEHADAQPDIRKRLPLVRGNLDRIVMKAIEKTVARRYQTAAALAADVERHLDGLPIIAKRTPFHTRLLRAATSYPHHRPIAIMTLVLIGALIAMLTSRKSHHPLPPPPLAHATTTTPTFNGAPIQFTYIRGTTELAPLYENAKCFTNRRYAIQNIPSEILGYTFTRRTASLPTDVDINAPAGSILYILINSDKDPLNSSPALNHRLLSSGWTRLPDASYGQKYPLAVYKQSFSSPQHLTLSGATFSGFILAASNLANTSQ
jgi:serine/threonine protein kinase